MRKILMVFTLLAWHSLHAAQQPDNKLEVSGLVELQLSHNDGLTSWLDRGQGKQPHSGTEVQSGLSGLELDYHLRPGSNLKAAVLYNGDPQRRLDVTEAYWHYRPVARSSWRKEFKTGFFYPSLSLENRSRLWSSPYTITPSTINSWIGEELRTAGVEGRWINQGRYRQSPHNFGFTAALFGFNDGTGSLLSWRGWTNSERQTGIGGRLPLADRPQFTPNGFLAGQTPEVEPFIERDNRIGAYAGAEWSYLRSTKATVHYYDNNAEPSSFERGQYAWDTRFWHLAIQHQLTPVWELLGQYMQGRTQMNSQSNEVRVLNGFYSGYLMLAGRKESHRLSLRWERFSVDDRDQTPADSNDERGSSFTLSYSYRLPGNWKLTAEGINIRSNRRERHYSGLPAHADETRLLFSARYYWM